MTLIVFLGLFLPIVFFGLSVYFFRISNKHLKLLVAFSGAFLLSLTFNELIPQIYRGSDQEIHKEIAGHGHDKNQKEACGDDHQEEGHLQSDSCDHDDVREHNHNENCIHTDDHRQANHNTTGHDHGHDHGHGHGAGRNLGLFILLGFFIQLVLDYLTKGVEHGHVHSKCPNHDTHPSENSQTHQGISFVPVLIGLSLHSFLEGMPLAKGFANPELQNHLLLGIVIHNIPIAIVFMSLLIQNKLSRVMSLLWLLVFALSGPAGVLFSDLLGTHYIADMEMLFKFSMAIVVGIFLHIATTILFETDENHRFNLIKFGVIVLGAVAAMIHF